jgi:hypothetical protein
MLLATGAYGIFTIGLPWGRPAQVGVIQLQPGLAGVGMWSAIEKTGRERELKGRTDDYTLNLYRGKGFVLDRKFLDPHLWYELEYVLESPRMAVEPPPPLGKI